ncbi:MAG: helix-turn-helix domain-containing protein [Defluviitaleaceae bacterium]|nr:helix-turn-helix domain-containing protein [Defluviitaleaceae bacterium]
MKNLLVIFRGNHSQKYMAAIYHVTQQTWSNWENGKTKPNDRIKRKIALDAGTTIEHMFY